MFYEVACSSKNEKLLILPEMQLSNFKLKKSCFFGEPLGFFITLSWDVFIFFMLSILYVFIYSSLHFFMYRKCYGIEKASFTLRLFLPYTPSCFYQGLPGPGSSALKNPECFTEVRNTSRTHLFVSITQCSAIIC